MYKDKNSIIVGCALYPNEASPSLDYRYGPYSSTAEAWTELNKTGVCVGQTVGILNADGSVDEYWFKSACRSANDLVKKIVAQQTVDAYTKSETDAKLAEKANASDLSTKANKATTLAGYTISDAYTKTETDAKVQEATGAIADAVSESAASAAKAEAKAEEANASAIAASRDAQIAASALASVQETLNNISQDPVTEQGISAEVAKNSAAIGETKARVNILEDKVLVMDYVDRTENYSIEKGWVEGNVGSVVRKQSDVSGTTYDHVKLQKGTSARHARFETNWGDMTAWVFYVDANDSVVSKEYLKDEIVKGQSYDFDIEYPEGATAVYVVGNIGSVVVYEALGESKIESLDKRVKTIESQMNDTMIAAHVEAQYPASGTYASFVGHSEIPDLFKENRGKKFKVLSDCENIGSLNIYFRDKDNHNEGQVVQSIPINEVGIIDIPEDENLDHFVVYGGGGGNASKTCKLNSLKVLSDYTQVKDKVEAIDMSLFQDTVLFEDIEKTYSTSMISFKRRAMVPDSLKSKMGQKILIHVESDNVASIQFFQRDADDENIVPATTLNANGDTEVEITDSERFETYNVYGNAGTDASKPCVIKTFVIKSELAKVGSKISGIENDSVEEYFEEEMRDTIDKIDEMTSEPCLVIPIITDSHMDTSGNDQQNKATINNVKYLCKHVYCDAVAHLGDILSQAWNDKLLNELGTQEKANKAAYTLMQDYLLKLGEANEHLFAINGNHDGDLVNKFRDKRWHGMIGRKEAADPKIVKEGTNAYFYVDYGHIKTRLVFLSTYDGTEAKAESSYWPEAGYTKTQLTWLANKALNVENGWKVIIMSHVAPFEKYGLPNGMTNADVLYGICNAFNSHTSYSGSVSCNYTGKTGTGIIAYICGHTHGDGVYAPNESKTGTAYVNGTETPWTYVNKMPCYVVIQGGALFTGNSTDQDNSDCKTITPGRVSGTKSQDLWNVMVYRPERNRIDFVRFGAGNDLTINV